VALLAIVLTLFLSIFAWFVWNAVGQTQQRFEDRSTATAQVVSTNAYWIAEVANQTLRRVDAALGPELSGSPDDLLPAVEGLPALTEVYIIDATAQTIFSTVPGAAKVSVADREYFTALRDGASFYTSPLITSRLTGGHIFVFSKRILRNGQFAGAIMVSFPESVLEQLWHTLDLPEGSSISLVRRDGQLMARYPSTDGPVDLSQGRLFVEMASQGETGTYSSPSSPVDGIARVVSFRSVPDAQVIALASIASDTGWRELQAAVISVLIIVSPIVIGLILGCWWIIALQRRDQQRLQTLATQAADLEAAAQTNTLLFREIHHRVKNNLQSVQALVRMQNDIPDGARRDLQSRFAAMAAMHEHIYQHDRYADIDAADFVPAVVDEVLAAYGSPIEVVYQVENLAIDRDHATPLALLLSELITNACKYAFPDDRAGRIDITLSTGEAGRSQLVVRDNGIGMDPASIRPKSMGMRLISGISAQMDGTYAFTNDNGTVFTADLALTSAVRQ
jgi:two-component sensor histidine kinase